MRVEFISSGVVLMYKDEGDSWTNMDGHFIHEFLLILLKLDLVCET